MSTAYPDYYPRIQLLIQFLDIIRNDPNSPRLEALLQENDLSDRVADEIRRDVTLQRDIIVRLETQIQDLKKQYEKERRESILKDFVSQMEHAPGLRLITGSQLAAHPDLIMWIEKRFRLPETGKLSELVENYRGRYYTNQCLVYGHEPQFCMAGAAKAGNLAMVQDLMGHPGVRNPLQPLSEAVTAGHYEIVKLLLTDPRIEESDTDYEIELAARAGHFDIVELLFHDPRTTDLYPAVFAAADAGHFRVVKFLVQDRVRLTEDLNSVISVAAANDQWEVVKLLLDDDRVTNLDSAITQMVYDPDPDLDLNLLEILLQRDDLIVNLNPAINNASRSKRFDIVEMLLPKPQVTILDQVLELALKRGKLELAKRLYSDPRVHNLNRAVEIALEKDRGELIPLFLADPRLTDLNEAIVKVPLKYLDILLANPKVTNLDQLIIRTIKEKMPNQLTQQLLTDVRVVDLDKILIAAITNKDLEIIRLLLARPDDRLSLSWAVVHAVEKNKEDDMFEIIQQLISDPRPFSLNPALEKAAALKTKNKSKIIRMLLNDPRVTYLEEAFRVAARVGDIRIIKLLVHDPRMKNLNNAVSTAIFYKHRNVAKYLLVDSGIISVEQSLKVIIDNNMTTLLAALLVDPRMEQVDMRPFVRQARSNKQYQVVKMLETYMTNKEKK